MKRIILLVVAALVLAVVGYLLLPMPSGGIGKAYAMKDASRLRDISLACQAYARAHEGNYPGDWSCLTNEYALPESHFVCRQDGSRNGDISNVIDWTSFVYIRGLTTRSPPDTIFAFLPPRRYGKTDIGIVAFVNGRIVLQAPWEFSRTLNLVPTNASTATNQSALPTD